MWAIILIVIVVLLAIWWFMTQNQKPAEPAKTGLFGAPIEYALQRRAFADRPDARLRIRARRHGAGAGRAPVASATGAAGQAVARRSRFGIFCAIGLAAIAAGCSSRPYGTLVVRDDRA